MPILGSAFLVTVLSLLYLILPKYKGYLNEKVCLFTTNNII